MIGSKQEDTDYLHNLVAEFNEDKAVTVSGLVRRERSKGIKLTYSRLLSFIKKHSRRPVTKDKVRTGHKVAQFRMYPHHKKMLDTLRDNGINITLLMRVSLEIVTGMPTLALLINYDEFSRVIYMINDQKRVTTVTIGDFDPTALRIFNQQAVKAEQYGIQAVKDWAVSNGYDVIGCNVTPEQYSQTYFDNDNENTHSL